MLVLKARETPESYIIHYIVDWEKHQELGTVAEPQNIRRIVGAICPGLGEFAPDLGEFAPDFL